MWSRGKKFILIVLTIWAIYFLINFFSPHFFDFLRNTNSNSSKDATSEKVSIPLRFRIYNLFFRSRSTSPIVSSDTATTTSDIKGHDYWSDTNNSTYVWGAGTSTVHNTNKLSPVDLYISPNSSKSKVAQNFRFNNLLVKENGLNILSNGTLITGSISSEYMSQYYFNIDIYDSNGDYLFSIPANGSIDLKNKNILNFYSKYTNSYNMLGYKGDGFMVIWSSNTSVESVLLIKIKID